MNLVNSHNIAPMSESPSAGAADASALLDVCSTSCLPLISHPAPLRRLRVSLHDAADIAIRHRTGRPGLVYVMLHGFGDGGFVWTRFLNALPATAGAMLPDLRGHGHSSWNYDGLYDLAKHARDMIAVLQALSEEDLVLVGHSMGGTIALRLCAALGRRVVGLVLVDCAPSLDEAAREKIRAEFELGDRRFGSPQEYADWLSGRRPLLSEGTCQAFADASLVRTAAGDYRRRCDPAMANAGRALCEPMDQVMATLRGLRCPALLIRGKLSGVLDRPTHCDMAKAAGGTAVEVAMAGHAVMADNPDGFATAALPFLASVAAAHGRDARG